MGRLVYDSTGNALDLEDRALAHLRIVVMNKLRRGECFMFDVEMADGSGGRRSLWLHPGVPLVFHFYGNRQPSINRVWVDELMRVANSANGLTLVPEPTDRVEGSTYV